jgi:hypothetical protein
MRLFTKLSQCYEAGIEPENRPAWIAELMRTDGEFYHFAYFQNLVEIGNTDFLFSLQSPFLVDFLHNHLNVYQMKTNMSLMI